MKFLFVCVCLAQLSKVAYSGAKKKKNWCKCKSVLSLHSSSSILSTCCMPPRHYEGLAHVVSCSPHCKGRAGASSWSYRSGVRLTFAACSRVTELVDGWTLTQQSVQFESLHSYSLTTLFFCSGIQPSIVYKIFCSESVFCASDTAYFPFPGDWAGVHGSETSSWGPGGWFRETLHPPSARKLCLCVHFFFWLVFLGRVCVFWEWPGIKLLSSLEVLENSKFCVLSYKTGGLYWDRW